MSDDKLSDDVKQGQVEGGAAADSNDASGAGAADDPLIKGKLPPASFQTLVEMLASQTMAFLGLVPDPVQKKPVVRLNFARHYIDTLDLLQKKTLGNLTPDEAKFLDGALHYVRMTFLEVQKQPPSS
ncbi:MAG TPA: DUF1844 domain-containing protein [Pirellulaceae bacterium]|nr:DUF1844 domain-containing protein [Pirellulaceae bacterium]